MNPVACYCKLILMQCALFKALEGEGLGFVCRYVQKVAISVTLSPTMWSKSKAKERVSYGRVVTLLIRSYIDTKGTGIFFCSKMIQLRRTLRANQVNKTRFSRGMVKPHFSIV